MAEQKQKYERHVIGILYTQRYRIECAVAARPLNYYCGFNAHEGEIPPDALAIFRAFDKVLQEAGYPNYTPTCTMVWDFEPKPAEVLAEVAAGNVALVRGHTQAHSDEFTGPGPNLREVVEAFLAKKDGFGFAELRKAAGLNDD